MPAEGLQCLTNDVRQGTLLIFIHYIAGLDYPQDEIHLLEFTCPLTRATFFLAILSQRLTVHDKGRVH